MSENHNNLPVRQTRQPLPPLPELDDDPDSIFNQPTFPYRTRPVDFTPKQVRDALIEFSDCTTPLKTVLTNRKITVDTFYTIIRTYPEVNEFYTYARRKKADRYSEELQKVWEGLPEEEELYVYDKEGNKSLSSAAAQYLRYKSDNLNRLSQIAETGSYIPISKQETTNRHLSLGVQIQGKLPADFDLGSANPETLLAALKGQPKT